MAAEDLGGRRDTPGVRQAQAAEYQHDGGGDEGGDRGDAGDHAHGPEGVGVEQQTAQGLALEHCVGLGCHGGVRGLGDGLGRQLRVGLAAAGRLEVIGDEVVGVDLGLGAGGQT
jgi:hypothetical protein